MLWRPARTTRRLVVLAAVVAAVVAGGTAVVVRAAERSPAPGADTGTAPVGASASGLAGVPSGSGRESIPASASTVPSPSTTVPVPTTTAPAPTTTVPSAADLPQTDAMPSASTPQFAAEMAALWKGVVTGSVGPAMAAFFPEAAYVRIKTIADPAADYEQRLVGELTADIAAAHAVLGPDPAAATLVGVDVPASLVHWVTPGTCANNAGYFEVPNARVVYRIDGAVRSFGIASLISWRGVWYVVHLGSVLRSGAGGVVDDPSAGPGISAPYLTC